jgi:hypothetical protein
MEKRSESGIEFTRGVFRETRVLSFTLLTYLVSCSTSHFSFSSSSHLEKKQLSSPTLQVEARTLPLFNISLQQATLKYRRGNRCPFFINIDDRSLEGECDLIGIQDSQVTPIPSSGYCLAAYCFIEGDEGDINERVEFHRQTIHWRDGKAYRFEGDATDFRISFLTIKKNDKYRNRRHYVAVRLFSNGTLYAESSQVLLQFRPGTRSPPDASMKGEKDKEDRKVKKLKVEKWGVEEVVGEFNEMYEKKKLSQNYSEKLREHNIQGGILKHMTKEDWRDVGIEKSDMKTIERFVHEIE